MAVAIPKKIMQTWKTRDVPAAWQSSPASLAAQMPGWEYTLLTDADNRAFVAAHFPDFLPYYDAFPYPVMRADAVRYMWLYVHGGIYLDLDMEVVKPLDDLFAHGNLFLVPSGNTPWVLTNSFMASAPGHPVWLAVVDEMKKPLRTLWRLTKHFYIMHTTGPSMLDRVVKRSLYPYTVLPRLALMRCSQCDPTPCYFPGTYIKHLAGATWASWDTHFLNFVWCNRRAVAAFLVVLAVVLLACRPWRTARSKKRSKH